VQGVEDRNPIRTADAGLAVQRERLSPKFHRGRSYRWIPVAPVVAAPREEAHLVARALQLKTISIVLDLMHPLRAGGRFEGARRDAGSDEGGARTNLGHPLSYRLLRPRGKCQSVAELSFGRTPMPGKRVQIDDATWHALSQLAKDRMQDFWPTRPSPISSPSMDGRLT
jgi:hypothetical protein